MENFLRDLFQQHQQQDHSQPPIPPFGGNNNGSHDNGATNIEGASTPNPTETAPTGAAPTAVPVPVFVFMRPDFIAATIFQPMGIPVPPDFLNAAMAASMMEQEQGNSGPPPASPHALQQLPIISVTTHDLVEPVNRECCICLMENELRSKVLRLPCAHILHPDCAKEWLTKHNTCPVCRYELPTDCPHYEQGRLERMRNRKPRFARHELDRLSIRELKELLKRSSEEEASENYHPADKNDLIEYLIQSRVIDLIPAPPPVEFCYTELKSMSISRLKEVMNDAGVFFGKEDVVEKDDLLRLFLMSGRLTVLSEHESPRKQGVGETDGSVKDATVQANGALQVETVEDDSDVDDVDLKDQRVDPSLVMEENASYHGTDKTMDAPAQKSKVHGNVPVVETVVDDSDGEGEFHDSRLDRNADDEEVQHPVHGPPPVSRDDPMDTDKEICYDIGLSQTSDPDEVDQKDVTHNQSGTVASGNSTSTSTDTMAGERVRLIGGDADTDSESLSRKRARRLDTTSTLESFEEDVDAEDVDEKEVKEVKDVDNVNETRHVEQDNAESEIVRRFQALGITQLQVLAREFSVDTANCLEKGDIIDRLVASDRARSAAATSFEDWGCGEMRALASLVDVDLSHSTCRQEMIQSLHDQVSRRPHVGRYLLALAPLARLTTPQLRAVARDWLVNVSDCLERGEIIHRLVNAAQHRE